MFSYYIEMIGNVKYKTILNLTPELLERKIQTEKFIKNINGKIYFVDHIVSIEFIEGVDLTV